MKIKFWHFEYDFDKDDAKIVIPVVLLLVGITATSVSPAVLVGISVLYYLLYFFLERFPLRHIHLCILRG